MLQAHPPPPGEATWFARTFARTFDFAAGESMEETLKTGWLYKKGAVVKNYKKRYFVLKSPGPTLCYFLNERSTKQKGSINLSKDNVIGVSMESSDKRIAGYSFDVITRDRVYVLSAVTERERISWVESIVDSCALPPLELDSDDDDDVDWVSGKFLRRIKRHELERDIVDCLCPSAESVLTPKEMKTFDTRALLLFLPLVLAHLQLRISTALENNDKNALVGLLVILDEMVERSLEYRPLRMQLALLGLNEELYNEWDVKCRYMDLEPIRSRVREEQRHNLEHAMHLTASTLDLPFVTALDGDTGLCNSTNVSMGSLPSADAALSSCHDDQVPSSVAGAEVVNEEVDVGRLLRPKKRLEMPMPLSDSSPSSSPLAASGVLGASGVTRKSTGSLDVSVEALKDQPFFAFPRLKDSGDNLLPNAYSPRADRHVRTPRELRKASAGGKVERRKMSPIAQDTKTAALSNRGRDSGNEGDDEGSEEPDDELVVVYYGSASSGAPDEARAPVRGARGPPVPIRREEENGGDLTPRVKTTVADPLSGNHVKRRIDVAEKNGASGSQRMNVSGARRSEAPRPRSTTCGPQVKHSESAKLTLARHVEKIPGGRINMVQSSPGGGVDTIHLRREGSVPIIRLCESSSLSKRRARTDEPDRSEEISLLTQSPVKKLPTLEDTVDVWIQSNAMTQQSRRLRRVSLPPQSGAQHAGLRRSRSREPLPGRGEGGGKGDGRKRRPRVVHGSDQYSTFSREMTDLRGAASAAVGASFGGVDIDTYERPQTTGTANAPWGARTNPHRRSPEEDVEEGGESEDGDNLDHVRNEEAIVCELLRHVVLSSTCPGAVEEQKDEPVRRRWFGTSRIAAPKEGSPRSVSGLRRLALILPMELLDIQSLMFFQNTCYHPLGVGQTLYYTLSHPFRMPPPDQTEDTPVMTVRVEKEFTSALRPVMISFASLPLGELVRHDAMEELFPRVMVKKGDDLRDDLGACVLFRVFNVFWVQSGLWTHSREIPRIKTYHVIPTGTKKGLIQLIPDVTSLAAFNQSWNKWAEEQPIEVLNKFVARAAGAFIGGFVLGVRDRHWDNILMYKEHTLLHVDFGHLFGEAPTFDAPVFAISPQMKIALNSVGLWGKFVNKCIEAYTVLRRRRADIVALCRELFSQSARDPDECVAYLNSASFMSELSEDEACWQVRELIVSSPHSWQNMFKQTTHEIGAVTSDGWRNFVQRIPGLVHTNPPTTV